MSYLELKCASHVQYLVVMLMWVKMEQQNLYDRGPEDEGRAGHFNFTVSTCPLCILTQMTTSVEKATEQAMS